jgi:hypothetical protein
MTMKNNILNEEELSRLFKQDAAGMEPDDAVRKRLEYAFMVKSREYKTTQNSFLSMFSWFFSWSNLPLKAAFVSVILLVSMLNFQPRNSELFSPANDTTLNSTPVIIDSAGMLPFFADSCLNNS